MHKLWKKRLKKALFDFDTYSIIGGATIFLGFIASIITGIIFSGGLGFSLTHTIIWTVISVAIAVIALLMSENLFCEETEYDKDIYKEEEERAEAIQKEKEKQIKEAKELDEKYLVALEDVAKRFESQTETEEFAQQAKDIIETIQYIKRKHSLIMEEYYFINVLLPTDIKDVFIMYEELGESNRQEMKQQIQALLNKKQKELQERFVTRYEEENKKQLEQRIKVTESREY